MYENLWHLLTFVDNVKLLMNRVEYYVTLSSIKMVSSTRAKYSLLSPREESRNARCLKRYEFNNKFGWGGGSKNILDA